MLSHRLPPKPHCGLAAGLIALKGELHGIAAAGTRHRLPVKAGSSWWADPDLNRNHAGYEPAALTVAPSAHDRRAFSTPRAGYCRFFPVNLVSTNYLYLFFAKCIIQLWGNLCVNSSAGYWPVTAVCCRMVSPPLCFRGKRRAIQNVCVSLGQTEPRPFVACNLCRASFRPHRHKRYACSICTHLPNL